MIEEALKSPNESPAETSRALLSFFSQEFLLGGEARFVHFFPLLLDRVFGPVLSNSLLHNHEFTADELKFLDSAWLLQSRPWQTTFALASGQAPSTMYSPYGKTQQSSIPNLENDPVVQLLSTPQPIVDRKTSHNQADPTQINSLRALSFFQVLSCSPGLDLQFLPNARSAFLFSELPQSMQHALIHSVQNTNFNASGGDPDTTASYVAMNGKKLLECLCIQPLQQKDMLQTLRQIISVRQFVGGVGGNGHGHGMSPNVHSPNAMRQPQSPLRNNSNGGGQVQDILALERSLKLNLSLWEHFFMTFVRFPMLIDKMNQVSKKAASTGGSVGFGYKPRQNIHPYGQKVYTHLLQDYIKYYFPHDFSVVANFGGLESEAANTKKDQALIRMMIEYWLERHVYSSTKDEMVHSSSEGRNIDSLGLESSYDLAQLLVVANKWGSNPGIAASTKRQVYEAPPRQVQRCIKILVDHLVCDPAVTKQCKAVTAGGKDLANAGEWPLPSIQTVLQPSLFNYIRTALRYGPIHVANSSFYAAVDLWLLWLEPWNVIQRKKVGATAQAKQMFHSVSDRVTHINGPTSPSSRNRTQMYAVNTVPKPNHPSKYTPAWESYVAANLHLYLVPLSIFLRRARELEFGKADFQKSMNHVQRVFRVFSPQLVKTIDNILKVQKEGDEMRKIVEKHEDNLGEFCPLRSKEIENGMMWNLDMLKDSTHNLLEEIVLQHRKTIGEQDFFERLGSRIEGLFGEGSKADEALISKLIERARVIVKFPNDYEPIPTVKRKDKGIFRGFSNLTASDNAQDSSNYSPERESTGFITAKGREQILNGTRMCNAMDVNFLGDPMYSRAKSHEIKLLVRWSLVLSNKLNVYFKLDTPRQCKLYGEEVKSTAEQLAKESEEMNKIGLFRFNLRWVADSRNWVMIYIVWKIACWKLLR